VISTSTALLSCLVMLGTGCVEVEQALVINKTGSATYELEYDISEQTVEQMKAMYGLRDQMASGPASTVTLQPVDERTRLFFDPEEVALKKLVQEYAKYGVSLERIRVQSKRGTREVRLKVAIDRLAALAASDLFPAYGFSLSKTHSGDYEFYRVPGKFGEEAPLNMSDPDTTKMLIPFFNGFRVSTKVQAPTQLLETNAGIETRYSSVWTYDFDKDPEAILKLQREPWRMVFGGRGVNLPDIKQGS
jgi:hypothetical protein